MRRGRCDHVFTTNKGNRSMKKSTKRSIIFLCSKEDWSYRCKKIVITFLCIRMEHCWKMNRKMVLKDPYVFQKFWMERFIFGEKFSRLFLVTLIFLRITRARRLERK